MTLCLHCSRSILHYIYLCDSIPTLGWYNSMSMWLYVYVALCLRGSMSTFIRFHDHVTTWFYTLQSIYDSMLIQLYIYPWIYVCMALCFHVHMTFCVTLRFLYLCVSMPMQLYDGTYNLQCYMCSQVDRQQRKSLISPVLSGQLISRRWSIKTSYHRLKVRIIAHERLVNSHPINVWQLDSSPFLIVPHNSSPFLIIPHRSS